MPKKKTRFRAITLTGKQHVADKFIDCVQAISDIAVVPVFTLRWLIRDKGSWYVYYSEMNMVDDIRANQRTQWNAVIQIEEV